MEAGILLALQSVRVVGLTQLMALVYALGDAAFVWVVIAVVMLFLAETRQTGALVLVSVVLAFIVCGAVLGPLVGRVRPSDAGIGVTAVMGVSKAGASFPCAYAASSFAAATVLALTMGRGAGLPAVIGASLISFACLYLGVNYPTDVAAGIILGIAVAVAVVWLYNTFVRERVLASLGTGAGRARKSVKKR